MSNDDLVVKVKKDSVILAAKRGEEINLGNNVSGADREALYEIAKALTKKKELSTAEKDNVIKTIEDSIDRDKKSDKDAVVADGKITRGELFIALQESKVTIEVEGAEVIQQTKPQDKEQSKPINGPTPEVAAVLTAMDYRKIIAEYFTDIDKMNLTPDEKLARKMGVVSGAMKDIIELVKANRPVNNYYFGGATPNGTGATTVDGEQKQIQTTLAQLQEPKWAIDNGINTASVQNLVTSNTDVLKYSNYLKKINQSYEEKKISEDQLLMIIARIKDWKQTGVDLLAGLGDESEFNKAQLNLGNSMQDAILAVIEKEKGAKAANILRNASTTTDNLAKVQKDAKYKKIRDKALQKHLGSLFDEMTFEVGEGADKRSVKGFDALIGRLEKINQEGADKNQSAQLTQKITTYDASTSKEEMKRVNKLLDLYKEQNTRIVTYKSETVGIDGNYSNASVSKKGTYDLSQRSKDQGAVAYFLQMSNPATNELNFTEWTPGTNKEAVVGGSKVVGVFRWVAISPSGDASEKWYYMTEANVKNVESFGESFNKGKASYLNRRNVYGEGLLGDFNQGVNTVEQWSRGIRRGYSAVRSVARMFGVRF